MEKADLEHSSGSSHRSPSGEKVEKPGDVMGDGMPPDPDESLSSEEKAKIVCLDGPEECALLTREGSQARSETRSLSHPVALLALPH